jgi:hypothetical protein
VGLLLLVAPAGGMTLQLALWRASVAMVGLWFRVFKRGDYKTRIGQSDGDTIGEIGLMTKPAAPFARGGCVSEAGAGGGGVGVRGG